MAQYTVRTGPDPDLEERIEEYIAESDRSKSEALREIIRRGFEADRIETERDNLERKLTATNRDNDDVDELVEYVEEERSLRRREMDERLRWERERRARERLRSEAGVFRRAWWVLAGSPSVEVDESATDADVGESETTPMRPESHPRHTESPLNSDGTDK